MDGQLRSNRVATVAGATPFRLLYDFRRLSGYEERRDQPGVLDFTFGDPHDPPSDAYVEILRESLIPQHELWFAYNFGDAKAIHAATDSLRGHLGLPFEPEDLHLTASRPGSSTRASSWKPASFRSRCRLTGRRLI